MTEKRPVVSPFRPVKGVNRSSAACGFAVMGKASAPGRTKTRLAPLVTAPGAAALNTAFLQDIVGNLAAAGKLTDLAAYVAYGPAGTDAFFRECLPATVGLFECSLPHFGDCLWMTINELLKWGHAGACVLNSDSPTLPTRCLVEAAHVLAQPGERIVIGPSTDGGYYLLGMKCAHRRLFDGITWSSASVFNETCERVSELHLPLVRLPTWYDVDDAAGLARLRRELDGQRPNHEALAPYAAPHTRAALARFESDGWRYPPCAAEDTAGRREAP